MTPDHSKVRKTSPSSTPNSQRTIEEPASSSPSTTTPEDSQAPETPIWQVLPVRVNPPSLHVWPESDGQLTPLNRYTALASPLHLTSASRKSPGSIDWTSENDRDLLAIYDNTKSNPLEAPFSGRIPPSELAHRVARQYFVQHLYSCNKKQIRKRLITLCLAKKPPTHKATRIPFINTAKPQRVVSTPPPALEDEQPLQVPRVRKRQREPDMLEDNAAPRKVQRTRLARSPRTPDSPPPASRLHDMAQKAVDAGTSPFDSPQHVQSQQHVQHMLGDELFCNNYMFAQQRTENSVGPATPRLGSCDTNAVPRRFSLGESLANLRRLAAMPPTPPSPIREAESQSPGRPTESAVLAMNRLTRMWINTSETPRQIEPLQSPFQSNTTRRVVRTLSRSVSARTVSARSVSAASNQGGWDDFEDENSQA